MSDQKQCRVGEWDNWPRWMIQWYCIILEAKIAAIDQKLADFKRLLNL